MKATADVMDVATKPSFGENEDDSILSPFFLPF